MKAHGYNVVESFDEALQKSIMEEVKTRKQKLPSVAETMAADRSQEGTLEICYIDLLPGRNGAIDNKQLFVGKSFALTGWYPEIDMGPKTKSAKDTITSIITSFGAKKVYKKFTKKAKNAGEFKHLFLY